MVVDSSMKVRSNCFVKMVRENFRDSDGKTIPQIHLIFNSESEYYKITEIEKMIKKYYKIEKRYVKSEKKLVGFYLKQMIRYLEDCQVMEVFSDHDFAFHEEFIHIYKFINNDDMLLKLPQRGLVIVEDVEDIIEKMSKENEKYYKDYYGENEKCYKYIEKIIKLLCDKILH